MLSTCVLLKDNFNSSSWSDDDFKSLTFLCFKFDLFILDRWNTPDTSVWLDARLSLQRVVANLNAEAQVESFLSLPSTHTEWAGNIDVFVDFTPEAQDYIDRLFPYRTYLTLKDVLNPDFMPEVIPSDR